MQSWSFWRKCDIIEGWPSGGIGIRVRLKIEWETIRVQVPSRLPKFELKAAYAAFFLPRSIINSTSARENTT